MNSLASVVSPTRRKFLAETVTGSANLALGAAALRRIPAANERLRIGAIGTGHRCRELLRAAQPIKEVRVIALCDVWTDALAEALRANGDGARTFADYRRLLEQKDLDAVLIVSPDHWHVQMLIDALDAGKDVFIEKPLTWSLDEHPLVHAAVQRHPDRIVQVGMQQRAMPHLIKCYEEVIKPGTLGAVHHVRLWWNYSIHGLNLPRSFDVDPRRLDWKMFCGKGREQPFDSYRFRWWRNVWDFAGGHLGDLLPHLIDVVHWFLGVDHPLTASSAGGLFFCRDGRETPDVIQTILTYPNKLVVTFQGNMHNGFGGAGMEFFGSNGTLYVDRQLYELTPERGRCQPARFHDGNMPRGHSGTRTDQDTRFLRQWVEAIRWRQPPLVTVDMGLNAAGAAHLGNQAYRKGALATWPA